MPRRNGTRKKFSQTYLDGAAEVLKKLSRDEIEAFIDELVQLKERKGRLFILAVGGSAANASHAVNDFRKICDIECYTPSDNVSELTARVNDFGWHTIFTPWLKTSRLSENDMVMVFSVGGGDVEKNISPNIVSALKYTQEIGSTIVGIVSRDGGYTKQVADVCILVPVVDDDLITPLAESFQGLLWHLFCYNPRLKE